MPFRRNRRDATDGDRGTPTSDTAGTAGEDHRRQRPAEHGAAVAIPAAEPAPAASDQAVTGQTGQPSTPGWTSRDPIVVGNPTPRFEPKPVAEEYRRNPYRPDTVLDAWSTGRFSVRAGSVRGYLHRYHGAPRQDDFAVTVRAGERQIIVAVADGVSAAAQSHIGSTTAVRYACQWLDSQLAEPIDATDWKSMIEGTAWALVEQARAIDPRCTDAEMAEHLLATTLVCAVIEAADGDVATAHVISIGDSGAWCLGRDGYTRVEGGKADADGGISSSAVSGLPRVPHDLRVAQVNLPRGDVLLLGTDGFGDPLGSGEGLVGKLFAEVLLPGPPTLTEFGHALDFSRETFDDDRTLVAIWQRLARQSLR